jgi:hypothetical protein
LAALGGDAELELNFVEGHPCPHVARNLAV